MLKTVVESTESTKLKLCDVNGCNKIKVKRGYCNAHYHRFRRHGDPLLGRIPKIGCIVDGCKNKHSTQGYCKLHFYRTLYGTPMNQEKQIKDSSRICLFPDCDKKHYCKGYCHFHYNRLRNGTPLDQKKEIKDPDRGCIIFGCNGKHEKKGYCKFHANKFCREAKSWNHGDLHLKIAMDNVRKRDKNSCQWFGCGKRKTIQVHHIFLISEHPELKYLENYMICYCRDHHKIWHKMRGDNCYTFL